MLMLIRMGTNMADGNQQKNLRKHLRNIKLCVPFEKSWLCPCKAILILEGLISLTTFLYRHKLTCSSVVQLCGRLMSKGEKHDKVLRGKN